MKRDFKGVWIPAEIIELHGFRKAMLISAYFCCPETLEKYDKNNAHKLIASTDKSPEEIKDYIVDNVGNEICEWCGGKSNTLQMHHYPISKADGGKEVVNICGRCHADFHFLSDTGIPKKEVRKLYEK